MNCDKCKFFGRNGRPMCAFPYNIPAEDKTFVDGHVVGCNKGRES